MVVENVDVINVWGLWNCNMSHVIKHEETKATNVVLVTVVEGSSLLRGHCSLVQQ